MSLYTPSNGATQLFTCFMCKNLLQMCMLQEHRCIHTDRIITSRCIA